MTRVQPTKLDSSEAIGGLPGLDREEEEADREREHVTQWKVRDAAYSGFNPYGENDNANENDNNDRKKNSGRNPNYDGNDPFVDLNFTDEVSTGLELLEGSYHIYMREPISTSSEINLLDNHKKDSLYEILDHNGLRLYFVSSTGRRIDPVKKFTWYDFYGQEILVNTVKLLGSFCENDLIVTLPQNSDRVPPVGRVKQTCGCRANYKLMLGDDAKVLFEYSSLKGQWLVCPKGKHRPQEFNIVDPEDDDLISKIFKIDGYVDFGGREITFTDDTPTKENFEGCAIHFTTSEIPVETKAVIISSAILLTIQFFKEKQCCGYGCRCLSSLLLAIIFLILLLAGIAGSISFFTINQTDYHDNGTRNVTNL